MTPLQIFVAIFIHLGLPLIGLSIFGILYKKIKKEEIPSPPVIDLFLIFATYGGLILVILTSLLWTWSGAASLGTFYLILVAPILMVMIAYRNNKKKKLSSYHNWSFKMGFLYFVIAPISFVSLYLILTLIEN